MSRFRTNDANVGSQVKKMAGISVAVAVPATAPGRAILGFAGRRALLAVEGIVMDPVGTMQRTDRILKTYKRMGQAVALYQSLSNIGDSYKSLASSSSSYQQNGGAGDTRETPPILPNRTINRMIKTLRNSADRSRWKREGGACPPGYVLKKVKGRWMCVRIKHRRK
jgi:hypothetical protein